jgi:hypothetical protein
MLQPKRTCETVHVGNTNATCGGVKWIGAAHYRFVARFFTSSSLIGCNMILLGCPGVLPEWPFDQSYEIAYAKIDPLRLNADEGTGPGHGSNAIKDRCY